MLFWFRMLEQQLLALERRIILHSQNVLHLLPGAQLYCHRDQGCSWAGLSRCGRHSAPHSCRRRSEDDACYTRRLTAEPLMEDRWVVLTVPILCNIYFLEFFNTYLFQHLTCHFSDYISYANQDCIYLIRDAIILNAITNWNGCFLF